MQALSYNQQPQPLMRVCALGRMMQHAASVLLGQVVACIPEQLSKRFVAHHGMAHNSAAHHTAARACMFVCMPFAQWLRRWVWSCCVLRAMCCPAESLHSIDLRASVSPADVADTSYFAGYQLVQLNTTRICQTYVPDECVAKRGGDVCVMEQVGCC